MADDIKITPEDNLNAADLSTDEPFTQPSTSTNFGWKMVLAALAACAIAVGTARWWMPYFKGQPQQELIDTNLPFTENTENDELAPLIKRLAILESQVNTLQNKPAPSEQPSRIDVARLGDMVNQLSAALLKVTEYEKRLDHFERHQQKVSEVYASFEEMKSLIDEAKPFAEPLNRFAERVEDFQQFQQPILELAEYAPYGIPTYQQIHAELLTLIDAAVSPNGSNPEQQSWWERIKASLKDMVHIRKKSEITAETATNIMEAYKTAKTLIEQNHTAEALGVLQPFEKEIPPAGQALLDHLRARAAAERVLKFFNDLLSSPRFIHLLMIPK